MSGPSEAARSENAARGIPSEQIEAAARAMRAEVAAMQFDPDSFASGSIDVFYERQAKAALVAARAVEPAPSLGAPDDPDGLLARIDALDPEARKAFLRELRAEPARAPAKRGPYCVMCGKSRRVLGVPARVCPHCGVDCATGREVDG